MGAIVSQMNWVTVAEVAAGVLLAAVVFVVVQVVIGFIAYLLG